MAIHYFQITPYLSRCCLRISIFIVVMMTANHAYSQNYNYRFRFVDLPENYRSQYVFQLDEDPSGMLWFVTNNGLHRYDGNRVLTFDMQSSPALPDLNIIALFADSHSRLWIATRKGLVLFDLVNWKTTVITLPQQEMKDAHDAQITTIEEGSGGEIFLGSAGGKLFSYSNRQVQLVARIEKYADAVVQHPAIRNIMQHSDGQVWVACENGLIARVTPGQMNPSITYYDQKELHNANIDLLTISTAGKCFIHTIESGAFLLDTLANTLTPIISPPELPSLLHGPNYAAPITDDKVAVFFAGYAAENKGFGIFNFGNSSLENFNAVYPTSFKTSIIRKLRYKKQQIFVACDRGIGIVSYIENPFYVSLSGLENLNSVRTIYKENNGHLIVASYQEKLVQLNERTHEKKHLLDQMISCIIPWSADSLLVGTEGGLPQWYHSTTNTLTPVFKNAGDSAVSKLNKYVQCLRRENDSLVWAGSYVGCYLFNPLKGTIVKRLWTGTGSPLQRLNVYDILSIKDNRFFATAEGLFKYNLVSGVTKKLFEGDKSLYADAGFSCMRLIGDKIWTGTYGNGILVFDSGGTITKHITSSDGLASNTVYSLPANRGYVVAGTSNGLSVINIDSENIVSFSSRHILPSNEFNRSAWFTQGDSIYMGTINGLIRFTIPEILQAKHQRPQVSFSGLSMSDGLKTTYDYNIAYRQNISLTIPSAIKYFSIGIGGLDDGAGDLDLYYRFDNTNAWQDIGRQREISFVNVTPGKYTIHIMGKRADGQVIEDLLTLPLHVLPAFYQTLWFRALIVLLIALLIWLAIKYREKILLKEQRLRTRIAGDLHDEVGSALTRIYFQAGLLSADKESGNEDVSEIAVRNIAASSQQALASMSDMVWSIDSRYDNAPDMVARMKDYIARLNNELDDHFNIEVSGDYEHVKLPQVMRQNVLLIFKEAVTNAIKYGKQNTVKITLRFSDELITMIVENFVAVETGKRTSVQGGHGIMNMKLRAQKIKGTLDIQNTADTFKVIFSAHA